MNEFHNDNCDRQLDCEFKLASNWVVYRIFSQFLTPDIQPYFQDVTLLLQPELQRIQLNCPSQKVAARLLKVSRAIALAVYGLKETLQMGFIPKIEILCSGERFVPIVNPETLVKESLSSGKIEERQDPYFTQTQRGFDLNELYADAHAVYITQMSDQKVLFANPAAIAANQRSAGEVVGKEVTALWDDDVLTELMQRLERDKNLWQYSYPGYRWSQEENSRIWRRDRYMFVANYKLVEFLGSVCRLCAITSAEKIGS